MLTSLAKAGIKVHAKLLNWNHTRASKNSNEDRYQLHWYWLALTLKYAVQSPMITVENLAERVQSIMIDDICYILWHWDTDLYRRSAEEIISMYWIPWAKYYVILMWHLHSVKKKDQQIFKKYTERKKDNLEQEGANYSQSIVPAMCDPWRYSEQVVVKRSAAWCLYIFHNELINWRFVAPDILTKRL